MSGDRRILILWALALALITWREMRTPAPDAVLVGLPRPWAYTGSAAAFAGAALVGEANPDFGAMLALAWTVAIFLGYFSAGGKAPKATADKTTVKARG